MYRSANSINRRQWIGASLKGLGGLSVATSFGSLSGCTGSSNPDYKDPRLQLVYGRRGFSEGRFTKPRGVTIDSLDQIYVVDMTGRIQVFNTDGKFLRHWNTPAIDNGKPSGLGIDRDGNIMVADTHYYRILFYTPEGELLENLTIGGKNGKVPGEFGFVTDVAQDHQGNFYIAEYGELDRIQKFSSDRKFICQFGKHGDGPLEFNRPQAMVIDEQNQLWITDSHNHRIQVVRCPDTEPEVVSIFGKQGPEVGEFKFPYGIVFDHQGNLLIAEMGNHRVQKLTREGKPLDSWGKPGSSPGELNQPWSCIQDSKHHVHVLDSMNHRIQKFSFS